MIIVREVFHAKPGMASRMATFFKEEMGGSGSGSRSSRIMTDLTGPFNKVIIETQYENLAAFEKEMQEYMQTTHERRSAPKHVDMYTVGKREVYRVW